ncbi:RHS repeat protein [Pseudomonas sp. SWRI77]|uniref:RHS repeat domain-containing protein n=1 Tax=Pseudomonas sp. SWRI77 TaxID=2745485 RepID=UPI001644DB4B|nr:RHS repeat protein [Pseudomonas sp. SWRI77]MBC3479733.1 RHS repeat protein [Pseudomonas sp. SWRI77]
MTTQHSVHSNAFNFMSFVKGGVDPRTGQYTVALKLPEIKGNDLQGPAFEVNLFFSPLNGEDSGYGLGWNLQLSQYTPHNQVLALSSGETYKITDQGTSPMTLREQKIDSFHVYREGDADLRVVHRSGLVEILTRQGTRDHQVWMTSTLFSPLGHRLDLTYSLFDSRHPILDSVIDGNGTLLFKLTREGGKVSLLEQPGKGAGGEPLATYEIHLTSSDSRVSSIVLPSADRASWRFAYSSVRGFLCVSDAWTPTGAHEQLMYGDSGHQFPPASGRPALPRVTRYLVDPGFEQALVDHEYEYPGAHNFVGGGTQIPWDDTSGYDNLYSYLDAYEYGSDEKLMIGGRVARVIERRFNRLHLMVRETTRQNGHVQENITRYHVVDGRPFEQQSPTCQLPIEDVRSWALDGSCLPPRTERVTRSYDNHGNLLTQTEATGVNQTNQWYSAAEEDGHPADPEGFVRHLKQTTTTPAATGKGFAPVLCRTYRYLTLPALSGSGVAPAHLVEQESLSDLSSKALLETTQFQHADADEDAFLHGRVIKQVVSNFDESSPGVSEAYETTTEYVYTKAPATYACETVLKTQERLSGHDGESKTIHLEHSLLTGEPLLNQDQTGAGESDIEIRYEYDALRRVTRETVAPGKPYEASRRYEYRLCANEGDQAMQWQHDVKQVMTTSCLDGLNRAIAEERQDVDNPDFDGASRPSYRARYDAFGLMVEQTEIDWLGQDTLELTTTFEYDDWGAQYCMTGPDGVSTFEQTDPVGTPQSNGPIITQWREHCASQAITGTTITWLNLFGKPVRIERFDLEDVAISLQRNEYDGLGRVTKESVGQGLDPRVNQYSYDAFDRLLAHTLPDTHVVHRAYAPHSREDLPISIKVNAILLGEQTFDGLGRRTSATTGGRLQRFEYAPGQAQPSRMIAADGEVVEYEYLPALSDEPQKRILSGVTANYQRDPQNGRLLSCDTPEMKVTREYFSTGQVKYEQRDDEQSHSMSYDYSLRGRILAYADVLEQLQLYQYDTAGRLLQTQLCRPVSGPVPAYQVHHQEPEPELEVLIQADFTYDAFGRNETTTTRDMLSGQVLKTSLHYDAFEREQLRTFDFGDSVQTLEQHYDDIDNITKRVLKEGEEVLRDEAYYYDRRGRLIRYTCTPDSPLAPVDPYGKTITRQSFSFDELDNITRVITLFPGGDNQAIYAFDNTDPVQLSSITNDHDDYPKRIDLTYDANGNLVRDEAGREFHYDSLNRLLQVVTPETSASYSYDPQDVLSGTTSAAR